MKDMANNLNLILQFIVAGTVVVGATLLSKYIGPKWGGLIAAAPHILTLTIIFVLIESNIQTTQKLISSAAWFVLPVFAFLGAVYFLLPKTNLAISIIAAYAVYFLIAFGLNHFIK